MGLAMSVKVVVFFRNSGPRRERGGWRFACLNLAWLFPYSGDMPAGGREIQGFGCQCR